MKHTIIMPDLGQTTSEGKIVKWNKQPGDLVAQGDFLLTVETDKVTMDVEAYRKGYLRAQLVADGEMVSAMSPIAVLTDALDEPYLDIEADHARGDAKLGATDSRAARSAIETHDSRVKGTLSAAKGAASTGRIPVSPAARALARELGIDPGAAHATGPVGLVVRRDVEKLASSHSTDEAPVAVMANLTAESVKIPHFYLSVDVDASALMHWREVWNGAHHDSPISLNDIFVRAAARALGDTPRLNVYFRNGRVRPATSPHVLIVVASERGLSLIPFRDPSKTPWTEFLSSMRGTLDLARQGRAVAWGEPEPPALAISNLGMYRVKQFTAIIPPGSTAALSVGAVRQVPVVKDGQIAIGHVCTLTLASDHRVVDGITAAKFLERMQHHLNAL